MTSKQTYLLGDMLSVVGAAIIAAARKNLEFVEGLLLAVAAVLLVLGTWISSTVKARASLKQ